MQRTKRVDDSLSMATSEVSWPRNLLETVMEPDFPPTSPPRGGYNSSMTFELDAAIAS